MGKFFNRKKIDKGINEYYGIEEERAPKKLKFSMLVVVALVLVFAVIATIFCINLNNNSFKKFHRASIKNFESSSFEYEVTAGVNGETYMSYDGALEFDLSDQILESQYHAVYTDYEYDAVSYAHKAQAYRGNYYGGKWTVEEYTEKALDFFSFYRSYKKGEFDAGALVRFTETNDVFRAVQLKNSIMATIEELSKPTALNNILHQKIENIQDGTVYTFTPEMDELTAIVTRNIASAYSSAKEYNEVKERIDESMTNLENAQTTVSYTISRDKYLTDIVIEHIVNGDRYDIKIKMINFSEAEAEIAEGFLTAVGVE